MNVLRNSLIALLFCSMTAMAVPASDAAIKELLAVTQAREVLDSMQNQVDSAMNDMVQHALNGRTPTANQQQAIDNLKEKTVALLHKELTWEKLEPVYLRLYQESLSEEEVVGMVAFFKTPAGQAVVQKMPTLTQNTVREVQKLMFALTPQMQKIQEEFRAEMTAASE